MKVICALFYFFLFAKFIHGYSYKYVGCFEDKDNNERALPQGYTYYLNSPARCAQTCESGSYKYFGLQRGYQCWCGNFGHDRYGVAQACIIQCLGDLRYFCGGIRSNSVYEIKNSLTATVLATETLSSLTPTVAAIQTPKVIHTAVAAKLATSRITTPTPIMTTPVTNTPTVKYHSKETTKLPRRLLVSQTKISTHTMTSIDEIYTPNPELFNDANIYPSLSKNKKINRYIGGVVGSAVVGATITLVVMLVLWRRRVARRIVERKDAEVYKPVANIQRHDWLMREEDSLFDKRLLGALPRRHAYDTSSETTQF